jgi:hypothetical protein
MIEAVSNIAQQASSKCFPDSIFARLCDSKANLSINQRVRHNWIVNFSSTNQHTDSFSYSGVNLEAKV